MIVLLSFLLAGVFSAHALETDNYLSWGKTLPDSSEDINSFIQKHIEEAVTSAPDNMSCTQVTFRIANRFKVTPKGEAFVIWSVEDLSDKIYPSTDHYLEQSIYRETPSPLLRIAPMAPNIQANGIYFGVDKLSHFSSTGRRYLVEFMKMKKKGSSDEDAEEAAIRFGLANEAGILGIWASGVFSYGDVEANYQGLRFYRKFCMDQQDNYLEQENGRWKLVKIPDIRDYISPAWDESFNLSFDASETWARSSKVLKEEYCSQRRNEDVVSRFKYYERMSSQSFSMKYVEALQESGYKQAPVPSRVQSLDTLCLEN